MFLELLLEHRNLSECILEVLALTCNNLSGLCEIGLFKRMHRLRRVRLERKGPTFDWCVVQARDFFVAVLNDKRQLPLEDGHFLPQLDYQILLLSDDHRTIAIHLRLELLHLRVPLNLGIPDYLDVLHVLVGPLIRLLYLVEQLLALVNILLEDLLLFEYLVVLLSDDLFQFPVGDLQHCALLPNRSVLVGHGSQLFLERVALELCLLELEL